LVAGDSGLEMKKALEKNLITVCGQVRVCLALIALAAGLLFSTSWSGWAFSPEATWEERLSLFSSPSLTTPRTSFNLGETVWAVESGARLGSGYRQRRFQWVAPDGTVARQSEIQTRGQLDSYAIPATGRLAQVGTWLVKSVDPSNNGVAVAQFVVHHPDSAKQFADLAVNVFGAVQAEAGKELTYRVTVTNHGPDAAQNVQLKVAVLAGASFQSLNELPDWSCAGGETLTCSTASLARGANAIFTLVYQVEAQATANQRITNTAEVSSATGELHSPNDTATATTTVTKPACTIGCPANLAQAHDAGLNGATVNYADPPLSAGCQPVVCNPPSGAFFLAGVTTVVCSSQNGESCSFTVTITGTVAITLNEPETLVVECHSEFKDPGATGHSASGSAVQLSAAGQVDTAIPGTYTITYTANEGGATATATRTVQVIDTTPPVLQLNERTLELRPVSQEYITVRVPDLIADASDICDGSLNVGRVRIAQVASAESPHSGGAEPTAPDIVIVEDCRSVQLRVARDRNGKGRVYTVTLKVSDTAGNLTTVTSPITVLADRARPGALQDDSSAYIVTSKCP
jgi:uncharacterized repeat protein (TIGR01451 family)